MGVSWSSIRQYYILIPLILISGSFIIKNINYISNLQLYIIKLKEIQNEILLGTLKDIYYNVIFLNRIIKNITE